ncbi:hypothetical protein QR685DRAFT_536149 [Neurospora intermedia]|uniref:Uncharacterized protein n=1 Tax=Neurospora intermedia TaxID=5142 RepID=A0ABR3D0T2_NEUIN
MHAVSLFNSRSSPIKAVNDSNQVQLLQKTNKTCRLFSQMCSSIHDPYRQKAYSFLLTRDTSTISCSHYSRVSSTSEHMEVPDSGLAPIRRLVPLG